MLRLDRPGLALLALLAAMAPAWACSCRRLAPEEFRARADVILYGRVLSVLQDQPDGPIAARVRVLHAVKGKTAEVITIRTEPDSAACGIALQPGQGTEYLLMKRGQGYVTNLCLMLGSRGGAN